MHASATRWTTNKRFNKANEIQTQVQVDKSSFIGNLQRLVIERGRDRSCYIYIYRLYQTATDAANNRLQWLSPWWWSLSGNHGIMSPIYIYIYIYVCVCVCVYDGSMTAVCGWIIATLNVLIIDLSIWFLRHQCHGRVEIVLWHSN